MKRKFNVAFFGSSLVSAFWNGAATYYRGIIRAMHEKGFHITFYEPDAFERQQHRDIPDPEWAEVAVYPPEKKAVYKMLEQASEADIIIKASGVGLFDELLEKEIVKLKKEDNLIIFWDVDAPATLDRMFNDPQDHFTEVVSAYDLVLTYGGGSPVSSAYKKLGARHCIPIYNALDITTHFPVKPDTRYAGDLAFLGNRLPDREKRVEEFFLKPASLLPDKKFLIGGSDWNDKPMPENVQYIGHVYTKDHNAFNCSPKAVLNISRDSMARYGFSPATRVFEAAGAGACLITDYWEGIDHFFEPGREILVANNGEEVAEILNALEPDEARNIGHAAYRKVIASHTYERRAQQLETILSDFIDRKQKISI